MTQTSYIIILTASSNVPSKSKTQTGKTQGASLTMVKTASLYATLLEVKSQNRCTIAKEIFLVLTKGKPFNSSFD